MSCAEVRSLLFPVSGLVILDELGRLLFVLTMIINRLKSLTPESHGRLNDSLIYIFLFMGHRKQGGVPRGDSWNIYTHTYTVLLTVGGVPAERHRPAGWRELFFSGGNSWVRNHPVSHCEAVLSVCGPACLLFPES